MHADLILCSHALIVGVRFHREPPMPEVTPTERRGELARRLMAERVVESDRLAEAFLATLDPRQRQAKS